MRPLYLTITALLFAIGILSWLATRLAALVLLVPLLLAIAFYWLAYAVPSDTVRAVCGLPRMVIGAWFRKAAGLA